MSDEQKAPAPRGAGKPATIKDVARLSGVGIGTVSRYLNGTGAISAETRLRVAAAIAELDYRTNANAAALRGRTSPIIGVLVPDLENPAIAPIVKAIERLGRAAGYSLIVTSGDRDFTIEAEAISTLMSRGVAGLILIPTTDDGRVLAAALGEGDVPLVLMDRDFALVRPRTGRVFVAHDQGMEQATRHLMALGHRRLLLLHAADNRAAINRVKGFERALAEAPDGADLRGVTLGCPRSRTAARDLAEAALASDDPPDAIISGHNRMLAGVLEAMRDRGLVAGRDLSVVTCDRTELAELHVPEIAWIDRNSDAIGVAAFEMFRQLKTLPRQSDVAPQDQTLPGNVTLGTVFHSGPSICSPAARR